VHRTSKQYDFEKGIAVSSPNLKGEVSLYRNELSLRRESMSFREDYIVYKAAERVERRTITYEEALFINDFIQNKFQFHKNRNSKTPAIVILNTAKKVTLKIPNYKMDYRNLINKLDL
jgi:hypothetical protein